MMIELKLRHAWEQTRAKPRVPDLAAAKCQQRRKRKIPSSTMLARRTLARAAAQPQALGVAPTNARNMATLREIELRLKSVKNIEKITKV
jgi:hypothetical protein